MPSENEQLIRRIVAEVWNDGNIALLDEIVTLDYVNHTPRQGAGVEGVRDVLGMVRTAFPDLAVAIDDLIDAGDTIIVRVTVVGTHRNLVLLDIPPSGRRVSFGGIAIFRVVEGKLAETWALWDSLGLFQQIGAIPAMR